MSIDTEPVTEPTPLQRLQAAESTFDAANRMLPPGMQPFQLPPFLELAAGIDALARILLEKGVIAEDEFLDGKATRWAELIEELTGQVTELKRRASGLVIAGPGQPV